MTEVTATLRATSKVDDAKLWQFSDGKGQITRGDEKPDHDRSKVTFQGIVAHLILDEWEEVKE